MPDDDGYIHENFSDFWAGHTENHPGQVALCIILVLGGIIALCVHG